jgi:hypothetical protein
MMMAEISCVRVVCISVLLALVLLPVLLAIPPLETLQIWLLVPVLMATMTMELVPVVRPASPLVLPAIMPTTALPALQTESLLLSPVASACLAPFNPIAMPACTHAWPASEPVLLAPVATELPCAISTQLPPNACAIRDFMTMA